MINVSCFCFGDLGVQQHGRNFLYALGKLDRIALLPWDKIPQSDKLPPFIRFCLNNARGRIEHNVGLGIGVFDCMGGIVGTKKIAYTVWETTKIPVCQMRYLENVDEIWIPSTWGKSVLVQNGVPPRMIKVVPEGVDPERFKPLESKLSASSERPFRFLCVAKWEKRKGIDLLIKAYIKAFQPDDVVELVLHCHNRHIYQFDLRAALDGLHLPPHPPIRVSYPVSESRLVDLINDCDAFVLPTRGEGWGLPIIEAMACAKPVIVTDHGSYLDFVNADNAFLVPVRQMVAVDDPLVFNPEKDYGLWAEPDVKALEQIMRHVFEYRDEARIKGQLARKQIASAWTWNHAAKKAWACLQPHIDGIGP